VESNIMPQARGNFGVVRTAARNTGRVLPVVRWVAAPVAIILLAAWAVLYLQPNRTGELFAWEITPQMSAMFMGAAYGAGAYFFIRVFTARRWHHVANYFPGIALFTWLMGIATLIHWNAFTGEPFSLECLLEPMDFKGAPISVYTWVILYATTPFLVPILWLRNRTKDNVSPDPDDQVVSTRVRWAGALAGALLLLGGLFLFLFPDLAIPVWPWKLTPLMARIVGAFLTAPGVSLLLSARDTRWSAWRVIVQQQAIAVSLVLLAMFLLLGTNNNPQPTNPLTWALAGSLALFLLGLLALLIKMDAPRVTTALQRFTKSTQNRNNIA
jgi:hypothetical protein